MKRYGYIIEQCCTYDNVADSFDYHVKGSFARTKYGKKMLQNRDYYIKKIQSLIINGTLQPGKVIDNVINERGKTRNIQMISMIPTIGIHAIMTVVEKYIDKSFMIDTAASIKGRGAHFLLKRITRQLKCDFENCRYIYKDDIQKFYENINQDMVMELVNRKFKDKKLITIIERFVRVLIHGLSIGMRPSQCLANLFLSAYVDHKLKENDRVKYYRRYCDDRVIQKDSYYSLTNSIKSIQKYTDDVCLTIKPNYLVYDITKKPLDFLGFIIYYNGKIEIRKRTKQRFARLWKRTKSIKRKKQLIGSFYGIAKHGTCKNLFKTITGVSMSTFAEFGYVRKNKQGKKMYNSDIISINDVIDKKIKIIDFELINVKKYEEQQRVVVEVEFLEDYENDNIKSGQRKKFFTASFYIKDALLSVKRKLFQDKYKNDIVSNITTDDASEIKKMFNDMSISDAGICSIIRRDYKNGSYYFE